jgi:hypothetical protein
VGKKEKNKGKRVGDRSAEREKTWWSSSRRGRERSLAIGRGKRESVEKRKGFSKSSALWEV